MRTRTFIKFMASALFTTIAATAMTATSAHAVVVLDQENAPATATASFGIGQIGTADLDVAQTFTVGKSGKLDSFEVLVRGRTSAIMLWSLVSTSGGVPTGTSLASGSIASLSLPTGTFPGAFFPIDVSAFNVAVAIGDTLTIMLEATGGFHEFNGDGPTYIGGLTFSRNTNVTAIWGNHPDVDLGFRTFVDVAVPEPATLALFGLGLAGLGFARRRKTA